MSYFSMKFMGAIVMNRASKSMFSVIDDVGTRSAGTILV